MQCHPHAIIALLALLSAQAQAIGMCEGETTTTSLTHVAPDGGVLLRVDAEICTASEDSGDEVRQTQVSVVAQGPSGEPLARFCVDPPVADGCQPPAAMAAWIKTKGLLALKTITPVRATRDPIRFEQRGGAACTAVVKATPVPPEPGAFEMRRLTLDVRRAGKSVRRVKLGETSEEHGDARLVFLPGGAALLEVQRATCGGPPPGYFGEDDGGDCMPMYEHTVQRIAAKDLPGCVAPAAPAAPAKAPPSAPPSAPPAPASTSTTP